MLPMNSKKMAGWGKESPDGFHNTWSGRCRQPGLPACGNCASKCNSLQLDADMDGLGDVWDSDRVVEGVLR
jgi:hypothetical protein